MPVASILFAEQEFRALFGLTAEGAAAAYPRYDLWTQTSEKKIASGERIAGT